MVLHALSLTLALAAGTEKPRLAVLELQASGVPPETATALYDSMVQEVSRRGFFDVVSSKDIATLLGLERQKEVLGCNEAAQSCMAELAGAIGSRFVLSGSLSKLGDALQLSLQMLDTSKSQPVARSIRIAKDVQSLAAGLPWAVAEATGTPLPPPPSTVLPWTLVGLGAAAAAGGAIVGINALSRDLAMQQELQADTSQYRSLAYYRAEASTIGLEKTAALAATIAGAALLGTGIFLFSSGAGSSPGGGGFALVPTGNGVTLTGVWP